MRLLIISHTEHYIKGGQIVGLGSTVREINHLLKIFDEIVHVAPLYEEEAPGSCIEYNNRVRLRPIQPYGGAELIDKVKILLKAPKILSIIWSELKTADWFQFRAPTGIGVFLIPVLGMSSKSGWFKYAGNWMHETPPIGYRIQRLFLNSIFRKRKVTINGRWHGQKKHLLSFENPCITNEELEEGKESTHIKNFNDGLKFLFVGRIENEKGVAIMIDCLSKLDRVILPKISKVTLIGDGKNFDELKEKAQSYSNLPISFEGPKSRKELNHYYRESHFLFLPSLSEGFPKVVAEAACYGCIPCVSNVSSIGQYINSKNGLLFSSLNPSEMSAQFNTFYSNNNLSEVSIATHSMAVNFLYARYNSRIKAEILKSA